MFIDKTINSTTRAPAEHNFPAINMRCASSALPGAGEIFLCLRSMNIRSLRDGEPVRVGHPA
jgi:hypothetical protein